MDPNTITDLACSTAKECLWLPLQRHMGYLTNFKSNVAHLKTDACTLSMRRTDINNRVFAGQANGEVIIEEVRGWLETANSMEKEAKAIEEEAEVNKRWLKGRCPNCIWRYKLGKNANEKLDEIVDHYNCGSFEKVTSPPPPPDIEIVHAPQIEGLATAKTAMKKILDALNDEKIRAIGVYGMGGVGKTTVVRNVNNHLKGTLNFSRVILVTVSRELDLKRLQTEIAKRLGMHLKDEIVSHRATELMKRLMQEEKLLIIFDDLWDRIKLADVGIPSFEIHKGFKFIFTSRNEDVCKDMEAHVKIKVELLSKYESWKLFKDKAGEVVDYPTLHKVAEKVANECHGLPLALVTAGRALNDEKNVRVWNNALSELKKSAPKHIRGMEQEVYRSLKLSYDHLQSEELKLCFLFCSLFPEDYEIDVDQMIRYWMGEGFLETAETLEDVLNKGHALVTKLKAACLLLHCDKEGHVMMHDIVRDVAISIASSDDSYKFLTRAGSALKEWPKVDSWGEYRRISVMHNELEMVPDRLECPRLLTLMMQENANLIKISDRFFEGMKSLRVLDLSRTSIRRLPSSISQLSNLRALCLQRCSRLEIIGLSPLKSLKELESLDLSRSTITELPAAIGELPNLRSLDLSFNPSLKIVPPNVISKLTRLEELKVVLSFTGWEAPGTRKSGKTNASLDEVASLRRLSCLCLDMVDTGRLQQDFIRKPWENLERFCFRIDRLEFDYNVFDDMRNHPRMMIIDGHKPIPLWTKTFFPQVTFLQLYYCKGLTTFSRLDTDTTVAVGFESLEYLEIYNCLDMEYVLDAENAPKNTLQNLQHLELCFLQRLQQIVFDEDFLTERTFQNLRYIKLVECNKLNNVFPSGLWQRMQNLTRLEVYNCGEMEYVLTSAPIVLTEDNVLPKLETMHLEGLPKLRSIWMGSVLPLQNVRCLSFVKCHSLKVALWSALAKGLPNLVEFYVRDCDAIEVIISQVDRAADKNLLPHLTFLELRGLSKLGRVSEGALDWPSLEEISVKDCPNLKQLPLEAHSNRSLRWVRGEKKWWDALEWANEYAKTHFHPMFRDVEVHP